MTTTSNEQILLHALERLLRALVVNDTPEGAVPDFDEAVGFLLVAHGGKISMLMHGLEMMEALSMARELMQQEIARRPPVSTATH